MNNLKEFKGREVLGMQLISAKNPYGEGKLKGETYSNYALKGFVISVNDKLRFHKDLADNNIFSITVAESQIPTEDGTRTVYSYVEYTTVKGEIVMAEAERKIADARGMISAEAFKTINVAELKED